MITPNNNATLRIDHGCVVLQKAFEKDGVYHDIVVSDGDRQFQLGDYLDPDLKEKIQNVYFTCLRLQTAPQRDGYFVYNKTPTPLTSPEVTQTQFITADATYNIGLQELRGARVDFLMGNLASSLGVFRQLTVNVPATPNVAPAGAPNGGAQLPAGPGKNGGAQLPAGPGKNGGASPATAGSSTAQPGKPHVPTGQPQSRQDKRSKPLTPANERARLNYLLEERERIRIQDAARLGSKASGVLGSGLDGRTLANQVALPGKKRDRSAQPPSQSFDAGEFPTY